MVAILHERILDSSLNELPVEYRWLFAAMMTVSNADGIVELTRPALARRANLTARVVDAGLAVLSSPDPHAAKDDPFKGRRIELLEPARRDWGWRVLNKSEYMKLTPEDERDRARQRKREQRQRSEADLFELLGANPHEHTSGVTVSQVTQPDSRDTNVTRPIDIAVNTNSKPEKNEESKDARDSIVSEFAAGVKRWNEIAPGLGLHAVTERSAATKLETFRNLRAALRGRCDGFTLRDCVDRVQRNTFLHGKRWCTFLWLFGSKNGELNGEKIWHDRYVETTGSRPAAVDPKRNPFDGNKRKR